MLDIIQLMKRDNNTNNLYFSPPSPNITFNPNSTRPLQRDSLPIAQFLPPNHNEYQHRYSNNIDTNHSNNAFAHLRYEISNLRSEFTKLIQKDSAQQKPKEDKLNLSSNKREDRVTAQSTIGFYNNQARGDLKMQSKGETTYFKNKLALNDRKNSMENQEIQKTKKQEGNRYHKKYSFQIQQKRQDVSIQVINSTKIQELQVEIRKLGELKHKSQDQSIHLKKQLIRTQKDLQSKIHMLQGQNQRLKNQIEQIKISLSLKNSLVEKLQSQTDDFRTQLVMEQNHRSKYQAEIEMYKTHIESIGVNQKSELERMHNKYEQQIANLQLIHQNNIKDILQRLRICQESERNAQLVLLQREDECGQLRREKLRYQAEIEAQSTLIETLQSNIKELALQQNQANQNYRTLQFKYQESLQQTNAKPKQETDANRMKSIQDENTDLKKRVQSYKKSVEQLNSSNNSSRQKLLVSKQQSKKLKEQVKYISDQLQVKQKLITSLYRDINILDAQIRHNVHLKSILSANLRFMEELNQKIIELQCSRTNQKYKFIDSQYIQQSP